ncbi:hypothetical protein A3D77_01010 [Candidatus Gottesmanbacteria bacterium RIFCSPHIGHO2_02_FULL_39_11]|uniref:Four helix bundle protein n=1 Tax=Candidatus Gottesmanbacteria bacterium RIFCSPHIGHO2_02_FULL_39_11 TaxID=1798382 RepID=A0A1F5ZWF6_9BACT|nr:MAG: hypothetical protein A3D77_01010 [Candidatus Gottesmanbacteria bacterium RIFCSPHIGHO2_02_FULL_39_11]
MNSKIQSFTDLIAWKKAHQLVIDIYTLTKKFPKEEMFGITNQIRRAAISISSNIAEGFSRRSKSEKRQFYYTSLGSLTETQNLLLVSRDVGYCNNNLFQKLAKQTIEVAKLDRGLISVVEA